MKKFKYIGALTDKLYSFKSRNWELDINNTIDIFDSLGSNIKVYIYGSEIKRILPLKNDFINEDWISNKTRYFFEGLTKWRINVPLMKKKGILCYISWIQGFYFFLLKIWFSSFFLKSKNLCFLNSSFIDTELLVTTKLLTKKLGFVSYNNKNININNYYLYYVNPNFYDYINNKKLFIFLGYNLRLEAPILNIKLRKKYLKEKISYYIIGSNFNDNLNSKMLGLNISHILNYLNGKSKICLKILKDLKKVKENIFNFFLLGNNIISRIDNKNIVKLLQNYNLLNINLNMKYINLKKNNLIDFKNCFFLQNNMNLYYKKNNLGLNLYILHLNLSNLLYEELNLFNNTHNVKKILKNDVIYLLGVEKLKNKIYNNNFLIFQGHHVNFELLNLDLVFPTVTFLEKSSNFLSINGNCFKTNFILYPPFFCRNDWAILNALYICILNFINQLYNLNIKKINYLVGNRVYLIINTVKDIVFYIKRFSINFYFKEISKYSLYFYNLNNLNYKFYNVFKIYKTNLINFYYSPYNLDILSLNSVILQQCQDYLIKNIRNYQKVF